MKKILLLFIILNVTKQLTAQNVGIGTTTPNHKLDIVNNSNTKGINITHTGTGTQGIAIDMGYAPNNTGIRIFAPYNCIFPNYSTGLHAVSGNGPFSLTQNNNYGIIGECKNESTGIGVFGISNSPSSAINNAGVVGYNFSSAADAYGVIGFTNSSNGAGVASQTTNASAGIYGNSYFTTGPAIKAECVGTSTTALELKNGAIKVSGTNKSVFRITAQTGVNINANRIIIPNTTLANDPNDMLIVTHVYTSVYLTSSIGVWWNGFNWTIFTQDQTAMPDNAQFNVLVVKQ